MNDYGNVLYVAKVFLANLDNKKRYHYCDKRTYGARYKIVMDRRLTDAELVQLADVISRNLPSGFEACLLDHFGYRSMVVHLYRNGMSPS